MEENHSSNKCTILERSKSCANVLSAANEEPTDTNVDNIPEA